MRRRGLSMSAILVLALIGTVLGAVLSAMLLFLQNYRESLIQNVRTSCRQSIEQASNTVENYLDDVNSVMELLEQQLETPDFNREDFFDAFLRIRLDVVAVTTYDSGGELRDVRSLAEAPLVSPYENLSFNQETMEAYTPGYVSTPHVFTLFEGYYPWVVTLAEPLAKMGPEKWVALDISFNHISSYINNVGIGRHGYCFLMDAEGNIIYHPQQQLIYSALKQENTALIAELPDGTYVEDTVIYAIQSLENSRWRVVGVSFVEEMISTSVRDMTRILIVVAAIILVAVLLVSIVFSRALSKPIHGLTGAMRQFEQNADNFTYEPVGGAREIRNLSDSFGQMVVKIQELMDTVRSEEVNLRKTELKALQAQINPHFLYNTLDSIAWMCEQGRNQEAVQMVNALARLFRISISRGHELIPIRNELQHAESYLQIQAHRYKNQFSYQFDVEEGCLGFLCNKITLQPIIENAIYHGINGLVDQGEIRICVRRDGEDVLFSVEDNGAGMEPETVEAILRKERSDHTGIGIKNVNDRLKIYFGNKYGITIHSIPDEGTTVSIRMPQVREEAEYENR